MDHLHHLDRTTMKSTARDHRHYRPSEAAASLETGSIRWEAPVSVDTNEDAARRAILTQVGADVGAVPTGQPR